MNPLNGVLPVDKPAGPTSHDIVAIARRALGLRRIGHSGTLDPFASGLLLLCLGPSTRLAEYLTALPKQYSTTLLLGITTDTDDTEGTVLQTSDGWRDLTEDAVRAALAQQTGAILQTPPRYSAKKVEGERLYARARRGEEFEPAPVEVTVHAIRLTRLALPEVDVEIECSSGTYIRAIARDVGATLGVGAHLTALRRDGIGTFRVEEALAPEQLTDPEVVGGALLAPSQAVAGMTRVVVTDGDAKALSLGQAIAAAAALPDEVPLALLSGTGELLAIGERRGDRVQPRKVFTQ